MRIEIPASMAAPAATAIVPALVEMTRCANSMVEPPLLGQHRDAVAERVEVAEVRASAAAVERVDVLDEVADDVAGVVVRNGVVPVPLARVGEAATLGGPAGDVERGEPGHRDGVRAVAAEAPEGSKEYLHNARIAGQEVREHAPVVVAGLTGRRAGLRLGIAQHARVEPFGDLVRRTAGLQRDARPRLRGAPERARVARARRAGVRRIGRPAAEGELVLEVRVARIAPEAPSDAVKVRCTDANVPVHLFDPLVRHVSPPTVPRVSAQSRSTWSGP